MNDKSKDRIIKDNKNRHAEYYGMQAVFDELFKKANEGKKFKHLMRIITSKDNILLAYRNIKRNKGSYTPSVDRVTIETIERMSQEQLLKKIENRFNNYQPNKVRRKEIPKPNGKTRPLGIPSLWDRLIQQCILQVLEPICDLRRHFKERKGFFVQSQRRWQMAYPLKSCLFKTVIRRVNGLPF
jgi:retron-type reverse transcriptase